jgi:hypothetical protein
MIYNINFVQLIPNAQNKRLWMNPYVQPIKTNNLCKNQGLIIAFLIKKLSI